MEDKAWTEKENTSAEIEKTWTEKEKTWPGKENTSAEIEKTWTKKEKTWPEKENTSVEIEKAWTEKVTEEKVWIQKVTGEKVGTEKEKTWPDKENTSAEMERNNAWTEKEEKRYRNLLRLVSRGSPEAKYKKLEKIGSGASGEVFRGKTVKGDRDVAIKIIPIVKYHNTNMIKEKFVNEVYVQKKHPHRNIVGYLDSYVVQYDLWIVLDYIDGVCLSDVLHLGLKTDQIAAIGSTILQVLRFLHSSNVMHRDIKCENVLLSKDDSVLVIDFGLAKCNSTAKDLVGTFQFMAPEMLGDGKYGLGVDIWAFGITLLQMIHGVVPYAEDPERVRELILKNGKPRFTKENHLPMELEDVLNLCLEPDPRRRVSASELLDHPFFVGAGNGPQLVRELVENYLSSQCVD